MALYTKNETKRLFELIKKGETAPVYLVYGDRYLCREVIAKLIETLLPDEVLRERNVKRVDGDNESLDQTLNILKTFNLFPGRQVIRVTDTKLFLSKNISKKIWEKAKQAYDNQDSKLATKYLKQLLSAANASPEDIEGLSDAGWKKLFGFPRPQEDTSWAGKYLSSEDIQEKEKGQPGKEDISEQYIEAFTGGIPEKNILVLLSETVDKRKKLYKYLLDNCVIIDLEVDTGGSSTARKEQEGVLRDLVLKTLSEFDKKIKPDVIQVLIDRVGFHPVAIVRETEKLALFADDTDIITLSHLNALVGRTREEALYELNDAFAGRDFSKALLILSRLQENGIHSLAIIATLRNHIKKMVLIKALQQQDYPPYSHQSYQSFQKGYLPNLKNSLDQWPSLLAGHPYVLYKIFSQCEFFSFQSLLDSQSNLLQAELAIKSSSVPDSLYLEKFFFSHMNP